MSRKRKGCKYCDINRKDWEYAVVPISLGIFGDYELNVSVSGYRKSLMVELEPERQEPMWYERININYCPYCGTKLSTFDKDEEE